MASSRLNLAALVLACASGLVFVLVLSGLAASSWAGFGLLLGGASLLANGLWRLATRHERWSADLHPIVKLGLYGPVRELDPLARWGALLLPLAAAAALAIAGAAVLLDA